jgi:hypothetical protein
MKLNPGEIVLKSVDDVMYENPSLDLVTMAGRTPDGLGTVFLNGNLHLTNHRIIFETHGGSFLLKQTRGVTEEVPSSYIGDVLSKKLFFGMGNPQVEIRTKDLTMNEPLKFVGVGVDKWADYYNNTYSQDRVSKTETECEKLISGKDFESAVLCFEKAGMENEALVCKKEYAKYCEEIMDLDKAIKIYEDLKMGDEVIRLRTIIKDESKIKITQKVVHGDEVTKTEIKDSVISKSSIGAGGDGDDLAAKLQQLAQMHRDGILSDEQFETAKNKLLN